MTAQLIFTNPNSDYKDFVSVHDLPLFQYSYIMEDLAAQDPQTTPKPSESETNDIINSIADVYKVAANSGCANAHQRLYHHIEHGSPIEAMLNSLNSCSQPLFHANLTSSVNSGHTQAQGHTQALDLTHGQSHALAAAQPSTASVEVTNAATAVAAVTAVADAGAGAAAAGAVSGMVIGGGCAGKAALVSGALFDMRPTRYCGQFHNLDQYRQALESYQPVLEQLDLSNPNDPLTCRLSTTQRWDVRFMLENDFSQPLDCQFLENELPNVMLKGVATPSFELCTRIIADKWARPHYFIGLLPWLNINNLPSILAFPLRRLMLQQFRDIQMKRHLCSPLRSEYTTFAQCKQAEDNAIMIMSGLVPDEIQQEIISGRRPKLRPILPVVQYRQSDEEIDILRLRFDSNELAQSHTPDLVLETRKFLEQERCKLKYQRKVAILKEMGLYDENNLNLNLSLSPDDYCYDSESNIFVPKIELDRSLDVKQLYLSFEEDPAIPLCVSEDHYRNFKLTTESTQNSLEARAKRLRAVKSMRQALLTSADGDDITFAKKHAAQLGIELNENAIAQAANSLQPAHASYDRITHDVTVPVDETGGYTFLNEAPRIGRHLLFSEDLQRAYVDYRVRDDEQIREINGGTYGQGIKRSDALTTSEACHFTLTPHEAVERFDKLELYEGLLNTVAASSRRANELNDYGEDLHKCDSHLTEHVRDPRLENTYTDAMREMLFVNGQISVNLRDQNQVSTVVSIAAEAQNIAPTNNYDGTTVTAAKHVRNDEVKLGKNKYRPDEAVVNNFLNDVNTDNLELREQLRKKITAAVKENFKHQPKGKEIDCESAQLLPAGEEHIFANRFARQGYNTSIHLLVDISGSMCNIPDNDDEIINNIQNAGEAVKYLFGYRYGMSPLQRQCASRAYHACKASLEIASSLTGINGVSIAASFFPGLIESSATHTVLMSHDNIVKKASQFIQTPHGSTPMHEALYSTYDQLRQDEEGRKIIILITDGAPDNVDETRKAIDHVIHNGVELYTIGIDTDDTNKLFPHFSCLKKPEKLTELLADLLLDLSNTAPDVLVA